MQKQGFVYILTNASDRVLYTGVTSDMVRRIYEHQSKLDEGFTKRYRCTKLVYYENCGGIVEAIEREKQIKAGSRKKKLALIDRLNPNWRDLTDEI